MHRYTLLFCLLAFISCSKDLTVDGKLIPLKDYVASPVPDPYQSPAKVVRRREIFRGDTNEVSDAYLNEELKNRAARPAANVVLNGDSLQISISTIGTAGQDRPGSIDQISLNAWGDTLYPQAINRGVKNSGIIGPQTVLKINRRTYLLNMLNESRSHIRISELADARELPVTASITTRYKRLAVLDSGGEPTYLPREAGKSLIVFFIRFPEGSAEVLAAYRAFRSLPEAERARTQVAVVNRYTRAPAELKNFFRGNEIDFPLYLEGPGTCTSLPCHARFPYFLAVNSAGRITEYYGWLEELGW